MSQEREIFLAALDLPANERSASIDEACAGDSHLLARVRELLSAHEVERDFLDASAVPISSQVLAEQAGSTVGRYRLLEQIGEGGFGVVYMAEQREPVRRKVALKIIKLGMDTKQVVARFEAERQALALMDHPNIAKVFDAGATETGRPYFVMELVRGMPITKYCEENHCTTRERVELMIEVCSAIQHAHQKGVIHRDIKPNNVLITMHDDHPVPKVIDFGIAKATQQELTDKTIFTRYHEFLGTPAYMSPEQAQLSALDIDTRTDIYSLGVLLYELLTGRTPFDGNKLLSAGLDEMRRIIREQEPERPSTRLTQALRTTGRNSNPATRKPDIDRDLDWIVMKAMEKDRARRYESASAFAEDIRRYLADQPISAAAPTVSYKLYKFARRHRTALPVAAVIILLLVAGSGTATWLAWRADRSAAQARTEAATTEAVSRFLNDDLFGMADPENQPDHEISVRSLLDRASQQLSNGLSGEPLVQAAIHSTIGRAYANLSQHASAEKHLTRAHELYQRELGEHHRKTIRTLVDIAAAFEQRGHTTPAVAAAERARDLAVAEFGLNDPLTVHCLNRLAFNYYRLRKAPEAFAVANQAWEIAPSVSANPEIDFYYSFYLVARQRAKTHGRDETERMLREALHVHEQRLGPYHRRTSAAKNGLAGFLYDHAINYAEAETLYREALEANLRVFGENHDATRKIRRNLALLFEATDRPGEALQEMLQVLRTDPEHAEAPKDLARILPRVQLTQLGAPSAPLDPLN